MIFTQFINNVKKRKLSNKTNKMKMNASFIVAQLFFQINDIKEERMKNTIQNEVLLFKSFHYPTKSYKLYVNFT